MDPSASRIIARAFKPLSRRLLHHAQLPSRRYICNTQSLGSTVTPSVGNAHTPAISRPIPRTIPSSYMKRSFPQARSFSSSPISSAKTILNPRQDEDGHDMKIEIMPRAANRLHSISKTDNNPSLCLRVAVESGGCHGFQYLMSLTSLDDVSKDEDTVFESEDGKGAKVVMDEPSLELLKGSKIDYTMELIGSQFKVTGIPGAKSSCGCGTSFDIQA